MKRSPLRRSSTPMRRTPMPRRSRPLRQVSERKLGQAAFWDQEKAAAKLDCGGRCTAPAGAVDGCTGLADEPDHRKPRSLMGSDRRINIQWLCHVCHAWKTTHSQAAHALGMHTYSWEPEGPREPTNEGHQP